MNPLAYMRGLIDTFPQQLAHGMRIAEAASLSAPERPIRNVLISGLGGSGIGGSIVAELLAATLKVPVAVNKEYAIPAFVGPETLVIISSYSGTTEETVEAMYHAHTAGAMMCCISSGGTVIDFAKENGIDFIQIPGGQPPRASLGFSLVAQFFVFHGKGLIDDSFIAQLEAAIDHLDGDKTVLQNEAMAIMEQLRDKTPVIYATPGLEAVAVRWRQQLNENSKVLCWHHVFPEMNHNELVGWAGGNPNLAVIMLRTDAEYSRNARRIEISKPVFERHTQTIIEARAQGASAIERALHLIYLGDWVSLYLAEATGIDPVEIDVINYLKSSLASA